MTAVTNRGAATASVEVQHPPPPGSKIVELKLGKSEISTAYSADLA